MRAKNIATGTLLTLLVISSMIAPSITQLNPDPEANKRDSPPNHTENNPVTTPNHPEKPRTNPKQTQEPDQTTSQKTDGQHTPTPQTTTQGKWEKPPGTWWNTNWEYRRNITVDGTTASKQNWPVHAFVEFTPSAHYGSIRVINTTRNTVIPYQPWNLTYVNDSYLESATISFMANVSSSQERTVQVYWSTESKVLPSYSNTLVLGSRATPQGLKYSISSTLGWTVTIGSTHGGTIQNITHTSGDQLGHNDWLNFGISKHPTTSYNGYWGSGNTNNTEYTWRGILEEQDDLMDHFKQTIFLTYEVQNVPLKNATGHTLAHVNYTYRFYKWGWTVNESIQWETSDTDTYWMNGWTYDQNTGFEDYHNPMFNVTATNSGVEQLPIIGWLDQFEDGVAEEWTLDNGWQISDVRNYTGSFSLGCPGTGDTYGYDYDQNAISTTITVPDSGATLNFWTWHELASDSDSNETDHLRVYIQQVGGTWNQIADYTGYSGDSGEWVEKSIGIQDYAGQDVKIRFYLDDEVGTNPDHVAEGVYIDQFEVTPKEGPEWTSKGRSGDWDYTAFLNTKASRGMGKVWLDNTSTGVNIQNNEWIWHNHGSDTEFQDYLLWARNCSISASQNDKLSSMYGVVPWSPTGGNAYDRLGNFNKTRDILHSTIDINTHQREKFRLQLTVNVTDRNEGVKNATVTLNDTVHGGSYNYTGVTDASGIVTFDIKRVNYAMNVTITSGIGSHCTYTKEKALEYSNEPYSTLSNKVRANFSYLVHFKLRAKTKGWDNIQNGTLQLENDTWTINGTTDLTGWIDLRIPATSYDGRSYSQWNLTFTADWNPHTWDPFNLTENTELLDHEAKYYLFNITGGRTFTLEDLNLQNIQETVLKWHGAIGAPATKTTWGENISGMIKLLDADTGEALSEKKVGWKILYDDRQIISGNTTTSTQGNASFSFNTSRVQGGESYSLKVTAEPGSIYNKPIPLQRSLTVEKVPTSMEVYMNWPSGNYWNEEVTIRVEYKEHSNALPGKYVTDSQINGRLSKGEFNNTFAHDTWDTTRGGSFSLSFEHFRQNGSGYYSFIITTDRGNFTSAQKIEQIIVNSRPTLLQTPRSHITIPWVTNYTLYATYMDETYSEPVTNSTYTRKKLTNTTYKSELTYTLKSLMGRIVREGTMRYWDKEGAYNSTIRVNGSKLARGSYTFTISASKPAFESKTLKTTFEITMRSTRVSSEATRVEKTYGEQVSLRFKYQDLDYTEHPFGTSKNISEATARFTLQGPAGFEPVRGTLEELRNGRYLFNRSTTSLNMTGTFTLSVSLQKDHYTEQTVLVTLVIEEIPTVVDYPKEKTILWGNPGTVEFELFHGLTGENIENITINSVTTANQSYTENVTMTENKSYLLNISTLGLDPGTYVFEFNISKAHYDIKEFTVKLTIKSIQDAIQATYEDMKTKVRKNPITTAASTTEKKVSIGIYQTHGTGITSMRGKYWVPGVDKGFFTSEVPGTYTFFIDWDKATPDKTYQIHVQILSVTSYGNEIQLSEYNMQVTTTSKDVSVDYWGGSSEIPGIGYQMANLWFYTMITAILLTAVYASVRVYNYLTVPPEVRKLREIIRKVEQGNYEYPIMTKEDHYRERINKTL